MDFSTDLLRVLWHELGHFCIDIIATDENKNYHIDRFYVSYHEKADSQEKWAGAIRTMPTIKFEDLINDSHKTAFAFISLLSGCIFQTVFYNEIDGKDIKLKSCLGLENNCAGQGDLNKFNSIGSEYRKKYGNREKFTLYINVELPQIIEKHVSENKDFQNRLNELAVRERDIILKDFQEAENKEDFFHHNNAELIDNLRNEVRNIMQETGFYKTIVKLKELLCNAIEEDIKSTK